jgi:hypothetical protein
VPHVLAVVPSNSWLLPGDEQPFHNLVREGLRPYVQNPHRGPRVILHSREASAPQPKAKRTWRLEGGYDPLWDLRVCADNEPCATISTNMGSEAHRRDGVSLRQLAVGVPKGV